MNEYYQGKKLSPQELKEKKDYFNKYIATKIKSKAFYNKINKSCSQTFRLIRFTDPGEVEVKKHANTMYGEMSDSI